uniref:Uncharacterized protein n=1 Tax=Anguilla anguilla TaxID=7936 RepID=A0A0E9WDX1_ANGAN
MLLYFYHKLSFITVSTCYPLEVLLPADVQHLVDYMLQTVLHGFNCVFRFSSAWVHGVFSHLNIQVQTQPVPSKDCKACGVGLHTQEVLARGMCCKCEFSLSAISFRHQCLVVWVSHSDGQTKMRQVIWLSIVPVFQQKIPRY